MSQPSGLKLSPCSAHAHKEYFQFGERARPSVLMRDFFSPAPQDPGSLNWDLGSASGPACTPKAGFIRMERIGT